MKSILFLIVTTLTLASCSTTSVMKPTMEVSANETNPIVRIPASKSTAVALTAEFVGRSKVNQHMYTIKQLDNGQWQVQDYTPCSSYPCADEDQIKYSQFTPKLISELHMSDGDTVIQLGNNMVVSFINNGMTPPNPDGSRQQSYWELEYNKEKMKLDFYPRLKIGK